MNTHEHTQYPTPPIETLLLASIADSVTIMQILINNVLKEAIPTLIDIANAGMVDHLQPNATKVLYLQAQLVIPDSVNGQPVVNCHFSSSDTTIATVTDTGLVSRVHDTTGTQVTITFNGCISDPDYGAIPVNGEITYALYKPAPIQLAILSQ